MYGGIGANVPTKKEEQYPKKKKLYKASEVMTDLYIKWLSEKTTKNKKMKKSNYVWIIIVVFLLLIITVLLGLTIKYVFTDSTNVSVNIEYNIGEILAAILGGGGIAIAGFGYAKSKLDDKENQLENSIVDHSNEPQSR